MASFAAGGKAGAFHRQFTHQPALALLGFLGFLGVGFFRKHRLTGGKTFWAVLAGLFVAAHPLMDT